MADQQKNIAFYLKYRPQSLDDLIGQDHVKNILQGSFKNNKLSHAYLFCGPRGTGKTSTARILAKMVNCEDKNAPCNKCHVCISITDGSNLDLIEIDAASNRGIEDIRSLREKIKLVPSSSKKKVYIIDEVHMLTQEAFNALLKTLEEPPSHILFILATTDPQKLPQTILSRVQRLDFQSATSQEILAVLQRIAHLEKIDIDEDGLRLLVKKSEGSFRDGIKFLDQISGLKGKLTIEILQKSLNSTDFEASFNLVEFLVKKDTTTSLSSVIKQIEQGVDTRELMLSLMHLLRDLVFIKNNLGDQLVKNNYQEDNYIALNKLAENFENNSLISILDILQKALERIKTASIPSLPLELAIVEICSLGTNQVSKPKIAAIVNQQRQIEPIETSETPITDNTSILAEVTDAQNDDIQKLKEKWTFVLETVRAFNFSLEALLRSINIKECTLASVIMEVPYSFHQRILESPKNRELIESVISDILGRSIQVSTVLGVRPQRKEDIQNIEIAADDEIIRAAAEIFSSDTLSS